ncbi:unnamed protein product, partial [Symbiodinium sp. KB8]
ASEYVVDGTPQTIPFTSMDSTSWGIYSSSTLEVMVKISDLRPFHMTERRSWVSVLISNHPVGDTGFIRFRAPEGYVWNFDDTEFVYQTLANTPIGTTPSFQTCLMFFASAAASCIDEYCTEVTSFARLTPLWLIGG